MGMEVVDEVADLFAQERQQSVLSEILGLTRGKYAWMQQGYVSVVQVMLPAPRQMMRHFFWLLCPAPDAAPESVGDVACGLGPSTLIASPRS